ncbi:MAG: NUDIX domain-containing protein [Anaerolineae bacterium]|nr:NUDIX domain-containing protein [Thermoflexales bacterium]MDW8407578.1 NUDIX domain-containing protein [Anaerolineae bacterium]
MSEQESAMLLDWSGAPVSRAPDRLLVSASAVIFDEAGRVLLMLRADNHRWGIPGGRAEVGESITRTVVREVFEETGLQVSVRRLIGVYSDPARYSIATYPNGDCVQFVNLCFECVIEGGALAGSSEGHELKFFDPHHLPDMLLLAHRLRIEDALARQEAAFIR